MNLHDMNWGEAAVWFDRSSRTEGSSNEGWLGKRKKRSASMAMPQSCRSEATDHTEGGVDLQEWGSGRGRRRGRWKKMTGSHQSYRQKKREQLILR